MQHSRNLTNTNILKTSYKHKLAQIPIKPKANSQYKLTNSQTRLAIPKL